MIRIIVIWRILMALLRMLLICLVLFLILPYSSAGAEGWGVSKKGKKKINTAESSKGGWSTTGISVSHEADPDDELVDETVEDDAPYVSDLPELKNGEWDFWLEMENEIYPSWLLSTAGMKSEVPNEDDEIGDPFGSIGVRVKAPKDNCPFQLTISSAKILRSSKLQGTLKKAGEVYFLQPSLDFDYDTLAQVIQPFPENIKAELSLDGKPAVQKLSVVNVRAVNDCLFIFPDEDGDMVEVGWTFAAYVNENHPEIHRIMAEARNEDGEPMTFAAYQQGEGEVVAEIESIWNVLKKRGLRYSSITTSSLAEHKVQGQFVRRFGESLKAVQANCVDGSVLMASILRRMGLAVYLIGVPGHMFLAVKLEADDDEETTLDELTGIETTMLADNTLEEAIEKGNEELQKYARDLKLSLKSDDMIGEECLVVDVKLARSNGVLPLREPGAK